MVFSVCTVWCEAKKIVPQAKSGHVQRSVIDVFVNSMTREKAVMAFVVTQEAPQTHSTRGQRRGLLRLAWRGPPQGVRAAQNQGELPVGTGFDYPPANATFSRARRESAPSGTRGELL